MLMHLAIPDEFESSIPIDIENGETFDEMSEQEIKSRFAQSFQDIHIRDLNFNFLASLK